MTQQPLHILLTGAASGLGRGLALHYAHTGAAVYAVARRKDELDKLARESGNIIATRMKPCRMKNRTGCLDSTGGI